MTLEEWARDSRRTPLKDFLFSLSAWRVWKHMAWMDIKHRYRRSYLGWLWSVAHFLIQTASLSLIFCNLLNIMARDFLPYFMIGLATFSFVVSSMVEGGTAFLISEGYIKQLTFPKQVYLLRSWATLAFTYVINMSVVFVSLAFIKPELFNPGILWVLPGLLLFISATFLHIWIMSFLCSI
jgi:lipopolysaccharide transport system permease protein